MPEARQTLFFSATMPREIAELADKFLNDPAKVAVTPVATTADRVEQRIIHVARSDKQAMLAEVLSTEAIDRALVFTRTKHGADRVVRGLGEGGPSPPRRSTATRARASASARSPTSARARCASLVATDIAARGIDVDGVTHVVNYDLPERPGELRPPHRPHRARRRRGHRHLVLRRRGTPSCSAPSRS